ncbi:ATP-binding cassette domain-containing protein [Falsihalocynthiibacter sp. CO-5D18]|uniref:ATP-binding cassette domain-containing protein n=1 Tax=Falsihalocynthiibacter sp. CO-5D18 TaxID=3240872 RepID=UPI00350F47E4
MIDLKISIDRNAYHLNADISLPNQGITGLVGPSGSGKTSLLRVIAGLETPSSGRVQCGSETWFDGMRKPVPASQRRVGMVFQDMRLFAHLTIRENLDLAAKWGGTSPLAADLIAALELSDILDRLPNKLSGGEARRAALARALAQAPRILLLDEPLTGLDPAQKSRILLVLARAIDLANIPAVFVSHDADDVGHLCAQYIEISPSGTSQNTQDSSRTFTTNAPKAAGPQISATWQRDSSQGGKIMVGGETITLPKTVSLPQFTRDTPITLQGSTGQSFLAGEDVIAPKGFVKIPAIVGRDGSITCGGNRVDLPHLNAQVPVENQSTRSILYFRLIAVFNRA